MRGGGLPGGRGARARQRDRPAVRLAGPRDLRAAEQPDADAGAALRPDAGGLERRGAQWAAHRDVPGGHHRAAARGGLPAELHHRGHLPGPRRPRSGVRGVPQQRDGLCRRVRGPGVGGAVGAGHLRGGYGAGAVARRPAGGARRGGPRAGGVPPRLQRDVPARAAPYRRPAGHQRRGPEPVWAVRALLPRRQPPGGHVVPLRHRHRPGEVRALGGRAAGGMGVPGRRERPCGVLVGRWDPLWGPGRAGLHRRGP